MCEGQAGADRLAFTGINRTKERTNRRWRAGRSLARIVVEYKAWTHSLEAIKDACANTVELEPVLVKLLDIILGQHRLRLERYERDLGDFERQYGMESSTFYRRFEAGELGDAADFFEWAGLYELWQDLVEKIHRLELAL